MTLRQIDFDDRPPEKDLIDDARDPDRDLLRDDRQRHGNEMAEREDVQ